MNIHWLRFNVNFFDEPKIQIIESRPQGDAFIKIWVRLLCLAMRSPRPGFIEIGDGIAYEIDGLAVVTRTQPETLKGALELFLSLSMIEMDEGNTIEIVNFRKDQFLDQIEVQNEKARLRMIEYRKKSGLKSKKPVTRNERERNTNERVIGYDIKLKESIEDDKDIIHGAIAPEVIDLPFLGASFQSAWKDWLAYRKERKLKTTTMTIKRQLKLCEAQGESAAIAMIDKAITSGWQGLFPLKQSGRGGDGLSQTERNILKGVAQIRAMEAENAN